MKNVFFISLLCLGLFSCKKATDRRCFKGTGIDTARIVPFTDQVGQLYLAPRLTFILIQDSTNRLVIRGGKNLVEQVSLAYEGDKLSIRNNNLCNFLRDYDRKILVEVHFTSLYNLHFEGTESLTSAGAIHSDWFTLLVRDGAGPVNLNLFSQSIQASLSHGWGDITLSGKTNYANVVIRSNGSCNAAALEIADSAAIISHTQGDIYVKAPPKILKAEINEAGNIYYSGSPQTILYNRYGTGELKPH